MDGPGKRTHICMLIYLFCLVLISISEKKAAFKLQGLKADGRRMEGNSTLLMCLNKAGSLFLPLLASRDECVWCELFNRGLRPPSLHLLIEPWQCFCMHPLSPIHTHTHSPFQTKIIWTLQSALTFHLSSIKTTVDNLALPTPTLNPSLRVSNQRVCFYNTFWRDFISFACFASSPLLCSQNENRAELLSSQVYQRTKCAVELTNTQASSLICDNEVLMFPTSFHSAWQIKEKIYDHGCHSWLEICPFSNSRLNWYTE